MSAILAFLAAKGTGIAVGALIPVAFWGLMKLVPAKLANFVSGLLSSNLGKLDKIQDPIRKGLYMSLALDLVRIAEYEMPDAGMGKEKYKQVADKLCKVIPLLKGQEDHIEELIEAAVVAMDLELKKQVPGA